MPNENSFLARLDYLLLQLHSELDANSIITKGRKIKGSTVAFIVKMIGLAGRP